MVHIQKIVVKNFKSFSGSEKLTFQPGFNVITGPNGSGKSNIIDGVQFVFGELGSRRMRVPDLSGLIFDGVDDSGQKRAMISQVTIYFDNSDRGIAIDKKIVSVGRKIDRQGRSKYFLNGRRTSRRAIIDLLEMVGINPGGYNIVLQGTATRLSDLTPSERMNALEDLIGLTEYDEKKTEAKSRLTEAERKIEIASARIGEVRKRVNELERQRNDALRHNLLVKEEQRLNAIKLSNQISQLDSKIDNIELQIENNNIEVAKLDKTKSVLVEDRKNARRNLDNFNKEASERGNTRLPLLKSELVSKSTNESSLKSRLRAIESRKQLLKLGIQEKLVETEELKKEIESKRLILLKLKESEAEINLKTSEKESQIKELNNRINSLKEKAGTNQRRIEELTTSLVPMQESLSGLEIEINGHLVKISGLKSKFEEIKLKKKESESVIDSLKEKTSGFEAFKNSESQKLEETLAEMEEQIKRQKGLRTTIEGANKLAKEAETTITQFSAKRDLWKRIVTEEKANQRIKEMGDAGALPGYHGSLRNLIKIDLKYQRAIGISSSGWIHAIVVDNIETVIECVERLKKTKLGMTKFLPLDNLKHIESLPEIEGEGFIGLIPLLIRYDTKYSSIINLIWGDTVLVNNKSDALKIVEKGYRAVTLSGDVYEANGGILGGYYRKPPDFSKLIPSEDSVKSLSGTIKTLKSRLEKRMSDLRLSGNSLRKFTSYLDHSSKRVEKIEADKKEIEENIQRLYKKVKFIEEKIKEIFKQQERENGLIDTLKDRKEKTSLEIDRTKFEISDLKKLKPSDVVSLEVELSNLNRELSTLHGKRGELVSDLTVQTNLVERVLNPRVSEYEEQINRWLNELTSLDNEQVGINKELLELTPEIEGLGKIINEVTSDVKATSQVMEYHQKTIRQIERRIEHTERSHNALNHRKMELSVESEKIKLQHEQRKNELRNLGFKEKLGLEGVELEEVESVLRLIKAERSMLRAINQLAVEQYIPVVGNYKQLSIRVNELEVERGSILKFINEVEQEKQAHFMTAFNEVCENFSNIFAKLTGGGDGRLELQKPEDPFSAGVDLYIQFPGKPMRLASGASGGERSVAAIAYLLAIQRFLKAPFYLFDEIDAHLDDLNVSRLADVLKENALESQFIVVTLKDVMVHNADKIYGIFSQGGRSRVLALPMKLEVAL